MRFKGLTLGSLGLKLRNMKPLVILFASSLLFNTVMFAEDYQSSDLIAEHYQIKPQDVLRVEVYREPDLQREVRVSADGKISLPLIGEVQVADERLSDVQKHLTELYNRDFLVDPQIHVIVVSYAERRIEVLGQVNSPGVITIPPEEEMTLTRVISAAHGLNLRANGRAIRIRRPVPGKEAELITVNFNKILKNPKAKDIAVMKGDTIFVPESIF